VAGAVPARPAQDENAAGRPSAPRDLAPLLREAAVRYHEPRYEELALRVGLSPEDRVQLTHPAARR